MTTFGDVAAIIFQYVFRHLKNIDFIKKKNVAKRSHLGIVFGGFLGEAPHSKNLLKQMREHNFQGLGPPKSESKSDLKKGTLKK